MRNTRELYDLCEIKSIRADKKQKKVKIIAETGKYLRINDENELKAFFVNEYNFQNIEIDIRIKDALLDDSCVKDVIERILIQCPLAVPFKEHIHLQKQDDLVLLTLPGNLLPVFEAYGIQKFLSVFFNKRMGMDVNVSMTSSGYTENFEDVRDSLREKQDSLPDQAAPMKKTTGKPKAENTREKTMPISAISSEHDRITVRGVIIRLESRLTKSNKRIISFDITDYTSSVTCKYFMPADKEDDTEHILKTGGCVLVSGRYEYDRYEKENSIRVNKIRESSLDARNDESGKKRCELHLHTKMSPMDAFIDPEELLVNLEEWGHDAVAVTDHGGLQAFPDFHKHAASKNIKVIYGLEAYMMDDGEPCVHPVRDIPLPVKTCLVFESAGETECAVMDEEGVIEEVSLDQAGHLDSDTCICFFGDEKNGIPECLLDNRKTVLRFKKCIRSIGIPYAEDDITSVSLLAQVYMEWRKRCLENGIMTLKDLYVHTTRKSIGKDDHRYHVIILARNRTGLQNLYELVSESHLHFFYKRPLIPKSLLESKREGLILGSACEAGEVYRRIMEVSSEETLRETAIFYDYLEIQPVDNNLFMLRENLVDSRETLYANNRKIVALGDSLGIPVVATCDAHFFNERDSIYRKIMMNGQKYEDSEHQPPLFMRTTLEMLDEFAYLGPEKAHEVVVENSRAIAGLIEKLSPIPEGSHPPVISGSDTELRRICGDRVRQIYGDVLPDIVKERMEREMDSIISNRFSVMYIIAQKLTAKSIAEGYLVGSRGSVGSSFVAYLAGITEINPLEAHYICPGCKSCIFVSGVDCGIDLQDKDCQQCGTRMDKAGYDIPFETFLGFEGDKQPDIDLNFSGEYQAMAHRHVEELFGTSNVFKAGTISTIKEKTAFGFVKGYAEDKNLNLPNAEINRLVRGISGVRKTTGQHPGGMIVLPSEHSIYEFTPVQRPADDAGSPVVTTHFDFHSLHDTLLKLDLLGHDDPTILKMLGLMTGMDPAKVDIADDKVLQLFKNTESLVLQKEIPSSLGILGIPEFGTKFARELLQGTHPTTFSDLVKISGLSHGTDVWLNNAKDLIDKGTATLKNIICTRDEIMNTLIGKGMDKKTAFDITERVRRGKGLTESQETAMKEQGIPGWYIKSCKTIKYMYPKAHAAAYVLMALRIAWFKVYHPKEFYASYFSIRADDFDLEIMNREYDVLMNALRDMDVRYKELSDKEKNIYTILEVAIEMKARGIAFLGIDLYRSHAVHHLVEEDGIRLPFSAMTGIGKAAANRISEEGKIRPFSSVEDFKNRTGVTKTVVEKLKDYGVLMHLPDSSQLSFFS